MTVDIKCPYCKKETDYNLNYDSDVCIHCGNDISYAEMYSGTTGIKDSLYGKKFEVIDSFNRSFRAYENYEKHINNLINFGSISKYLAKQYLKNFIDEEHTDAIVYNIVFIRIFNKCINFNFCFFKTLSSQLFNPCFHNTIATALTS